MLELYVHLFMLNNNVNVLKMPNIALKWIKNTEGRLFMQNTGHWMKQIAKTGTQNRADMVQILVRRLRVKKVVELRQPGSTIY